MSAIVWRARDLDGDTDVVTLENHLAEAERVRSQYLVRAIFHSPDTGAKAFVLRRTQDVSGVSGVGIVADGVEFPDGCVVLRWRGGNPTSVVFHDNGMESVAAIHGHSGNTEVVWISEDLGERAAEMDECEERGFGKARDACIAAVERVPTSTLAYGDQSLDEAYDDAIADVIAALRGVTP